MNAISSMSKAYVKKAFMTYLPPSNFRIEMEVVINLPNSNLNYNVPMKYYDPNWKLVDEKLVYSNEHINVPEIRKYSILNHIEVEGTDRIIELKEQDKELLLSKIYSLCSGELLLNRSSVEQKMFEFFSLDIDELDEMDDAELEIYQEKFKGLIE